MNKMADNFEAEAKNLRDQFASYNFAKQAFDTFSVGTTEDMGPLVKYLFG